MSSVDPEYIRNVFEVVARGTWLYGATVPMPVLVIETDFDFWYEVAAADGELDSTEMPKLNPDGKSYYFRFHELEPDHSMWPDGIGYLTLREAKLAAQGRVPSQIDWA